MSNIEENAFKIARYLLENSQEDGQVVIRDSLGLSDEDFRLALKFLVDGECCKTYGRFGEKEAGIRSKNLAKLQDFVSRKSENRVLLSLDAELMLKFLFDSQTPANGSEQTMAALGWGEKRHLEAYEILKSKRYIDAQYADDKPFDIWITNDGREIVRDNFHLPIRRENRINIEKIGDNSIVNIGSTFSSVNQSIQVNSFLSPSEKQGIASLLKQLVEALKQIPPEKADDAEAVEKMAKDLIENATKEKPNKRIIEISADSLKKAAKNLAAVLPPVLLIAEKLISFILALHR